MATFIGNYDFAFVFEKAGTYFEQLPKDLINPLMMYVYGPVHIKVLSYTKGLYVEIPMFVCIESSNNYTMFSIDIYPEDLHQIIKKEVTRVTHKGVIYDIWPDYKKRINISLFAESLPHPKAYFFQYILDENTTEFFLGKLERIYNDNRDDKLKGNTYY